jgi:hypothetical protein
MIHIKIQIVHQTMKILSFFIRQTDRWTICPKLLQTAVYFFKKRLTYIHLSHLDILVKFV